MCSKIGWMNGTDGWMVEKDIRRVPQYSSNFVGIYNMNIFTYIFLKIVTNILIGFTI